MPADSAVRIAVVYPELLGTYGDRGNALVLEQRLRWRGHRAETVTVGLEESLPVSCDLYLLGGGEDEAQLLACRRLRGSRLAMAVESGAVVLGVCAGLQLLGHSFEGSDATTHEGLGLLDLTSRRGTERAIGEVLVDVDPALGLEALNGFENHAGITTLGPGARPLGRVRRGVGNGDGDGAEGAYAGRVLATYLHGPVLPRNPQLADLLLSWAVGDDLPPIALPEVDLLRRERLAAGGRRLRRRAAAG